MQMCINVKKAIEDLKANFQKWEFAGTIETLIQPEIFINPLRPNTLVNVDYKKKRGFNGTIINVQW